MTKPKTTPKAKAIDRKRISEALLADRLGLNEEWIERWEERGKIREESHMLDRLPDFVGKKYKKGQIKDVESEIERLVAAGCRRRVVYFCLAQLSPEATRLREGEEKTPVFRRGKEDLEDAEFYDTQIRDMASSEDLEAVSNSAKKAREKIRHYHRELLLVAQSCDYPLPAGCECRPKTALEALDLLEDSLIWAAALADGYTTPMETTLLKSKGLLYLTLYVSIFADSKKLLGSRPSDFHRETSKPSGAARARKNYTSGDALTNLATTLSPRGTGWSSSDLSRKLGAFEEDHPRLYKRLVSKLKELHDFAAR